MTRFALNNQRITLSLLLIIVIAGIDAYIKLPKAYDPGFIIRTAQIISYFPGASPERVEKLLTSQIEDAVKEIPELDYVKSESRTGVSITTVNIKESYKKLRPIWDNLRRKIEDIKPDLPEGVTGPFVNDEFGDVYGIVLSLTGEGFNNHELKNYAEQIKRQLLRLSDVAKVDFFGDQDESIYIDYDNSLMSNLGISASYLSQVLSTRNIVLPGGSIKQGQERLSLEPSGNYQSLDDIKKTIIQVPGSDKLIYLQAIANIYRSPVIPEKSRVIADGRLGIAIAVSMREGGNNIHLGEQVRALIQSQLQTLPYGITLDLINFSPQEVQQKVSSFVTNLLQAIIIVSIVMLFTLGLRTGLIVAALIPLTMLMTLSIMAFFGIGLDQISLAALIIALGMLVDNGIVMSENIMTQIQAGKKAFQAAIDSASELRIPLLTASLTTAAAFLPIFLAESNVGEFTASLFKVVSISLLSSWFITLTIIPLLCLLFLKIDPREESFDNPFYNTYRSGLAYCLNHKYLVLGIVTLIFIIAMGGFRYIPNVFFPPSDRSYFKMELELPLGSDISAMTNIVEQINQFIDKDLHVNDTREQGVTSYIAYAGTGGPRFVLSHNPKPASSNYAIYVLNMDADTSIQQTMDALNQFTQQHFPDLDVTLRRIETGPSIVYPIEVRLSGTNEAALFASVNSVRQKFYELQGLQNISDNWGNKIKKLNIEINQERALSAGLSSQDIAVSLQTGLSGLELTEYRDGEDIIPVVLRSNIADEDEIGKIETLSLYSQTTGKSVPLRQVADIKLEWQSANIHRRNGVKTVSVRAQLTGELTANAVLQQLKPWLETDAQTWPGDVQYEWGGEAETSGKSNQSIAEKLPIAVFIILFLLIAQFNSIRKPAIILTTVPLGLIGVVAGLLLMHSFFGFMTLLGIISLAGIVINNAIVLLERIQLEIDSGTAPYSAVLLAAQSRLRPILLTTLTTICGLLPLYFGGGLLWEPMAITIMAGLLFSTILTLFVVPVLYVLLYNVKHS